MKGDKKSGRWGGGGTSIYVGEKKNQKKETRDAQKLHERKEKKKPLATGTRVVNTLLESGIEETRRKKWARQEKMQNSGRERAEAGQRKGE